MNREIKFRGRYEGDWLFGDLTHVLQMMCVDQTLVEQETIGQFTGLYDKNGKEIYEGDIVYQRTYSGNRPCVVRFDEGAFIVGYHKGSSTKHAPMLIKNSCVVIGNIHDNPELIK